MTDWTDGGWTLNDAIVLAKELHTAGVDRIDGTSGAVAPARHPPTPLMHLPLIGRLRTDQTPEEANKIVQGHNSDPVIIRREMLKDPYWPRHAADALKDDRLLYPNPYEH